jgi:hypothetical protein
MTHLDSYDDTARRQRRRGSEDWTREEFGGQGHDGLQTKIALTRNMMAKYASELADTKKLGYADSSLSASLIDIHYVVVFFSIRCGGSHGSADDSVMELMQSHRMSHLREKTERERSFGDLTKVRLGSETKGDPSCVSAPTSPLKMSWGQGEDGASHASSPERAVGAPPWISSSTGREMHADLGLAGDVVLPILSLRSTSFGGSGGGAREGSGDALDECAGSRGATPDPMAASYESVGMNATWRSVPDEMHKLSITQEGLHPAQRLRTASATSSTGSPPRRSRAASEDKYAANHSVVVILMSSQWLVRDGFPRRRLR